LTVARRLSEGNITQNDFFYILNEEAQNDGGDMKKTLGFGVWAFLTLLASIEVGAAPQGKVPQTVWDKTKKKPSSE
jgi:hypothetical protein